MADDLEMPPPLMCSQGGIPFNKRHLDKKDAEIERLLRQLKAMTNCARARGDLLDTPAVRAALEQ